MDVGGANNGRKWLIRVVLRNKTGIIKFPQLRQPHASHTDSMFPSFVEFQYSLFHPICRFVGIPVLVHALTLMK